MQVVGEKGPNYQDHLGEMLRRLKEKDRARLVAAGVRAYHEAKGGIRPFADVHGALLKMRRAGLGLYVASEGKSVKQWDKLLRMNVHKYFDGVFISEDVGAEKSVKFYSHIMKKLRVHPEEALMIGDRVERDFVPAKKAGLHAILIDRSAKKKKPDVARNLQEAAELACAMM
ncbi:MAG: HAD-IA family hydrolase, partial [Candidatus Burarchaeum sp.]